MKIFINIVDRTLLHEKLQTLHGADYWVNQSAKIWACAWLSTIEFQFTNDDFSEISIIKLR